MQNTSNTSFCSRWLQGSQRKVVPNNTSWLDTAPMLWQENPWAHYRQSACVQPNYGIVSVSDRSPVGMWLHNYTNCIRTQMSCTTMKRHTTIRIFHTGNHWRECYRTSTKWERTAIHLSGHKGCMHRQIHFVRNACIIKFILHAYDKLMSLKRYLC